MLTEGSERPFDFGADLFAGIDVLEDNFFEAGEVFVSLNVVSSTSLRRLLKP
jgi:hypothetical protein